MRFLYPLAARLLAASLLVGSFAVSAQTYPNKVIEWVVPYPAGGGTDVVARTLADAMSKTLGQPIIINNKAGAATNIGAEYVAHAKPDGYTIMSADTATLAANPSLYGKLPYSAEKDFAPVGLTVRFPLILVVNPKVPAKNLKEFTAWAKAQSSLNYATPGQGSPHHLAMALFGEKTGIAMTQVPYRGAAPAVQDVVGGQVPFMFVVTAIASPFIASGKLRAIGIASPKRVTNFEDIATLQEQGLAGFEAFAWQGVVVPAATPPDVIAKLQGALMAAMESTPIKARMQALGLESIPSTPAQMAKYATTEREKWGKLIKALGLKVD